VIKTEFLFTISILLKEEKKSEENKENHQRGEAILTDLQILRIDIKEMFNCQ